MLGFTLATVSVAGLLKTASTVVLFLPLLVLAVPIIDTSFVVLKRLKYRQPISAADRSHLHHRFIEHRLRPAPRGGRRCGPGRRASGPPRSRRASSPSARAASGTRGRRVAVVAIALGALAFSVYIVYLLEIVKLGNPRIRRRLEEQVERERRSRVARLQRRPRLGPLSRTPPAGR